VILLELPVILWQRSFLRFFGRKLLFAGLIPEKWTVEKCSSAQVKGAEGNEEKSVQ
jgi:hypothetical protein